MDLLISFHSEIAQLELEATSDYQIVQSMQNDLVLRDINLLHLRFHADLVYYCGRFVRQPIIA